MSAQVPSKKRAAQIVPCVETSGAMQPLDLSAVSLRGEFGRRVERMIDANILKTDIDKTFLAELRNRVKEGYTGFGKFIDSVVRLALATGDARLLELKQRAVAELLATQEPDGYIGIIADPRRRMQAIWDLHEGAYLIWGLVSDYRFFGERASLEAARRLADYILARFALEPELTPDTLGIMPFKVTSIGIDRAMLALSEASGDSKYRDLAAEYFKLNEYNPEVEYGTASAASHAYSDFARCLGQLDLHRHTQNPQLLRFTRRVLDFLLNREGLLITGSCSVYECWHDTQYGGENTMETCSSVYLGLLMDSLLQLEGKSLYGDLMERNIYNALFSATTPDGRYTYYHTPFEGKRHPDLGGFFPRCCANNNRRFLAELRSWIYYRTGNGVAVNLYNASSATVEIAQNNTLRIEQQTDYPSSGGVRIKIDPAKEAQFEVKLRIPRWCREATVSVNGVMSTVSGGQFYGITRTWRPGDVIELSMPMSWRFIRGRRSQLGRAAILRGPVIYTFNPERNAGLAQQDGFDLRLVKINPMEVDEAQPDDSVRPGGLACPIKAWPPGTDNPWPFIERVAMVLTEYPDPKGEGIYFLIPDPHLPVFTDDELMEWS